jgi:hypothetical protein
MSHCQKFLVCFLSFLTLSRCGAGDKKRQPDPKVAPKSPVSSEAEFVTASVVFSSGDPAPQYQLWMIDHNLSRTKVFYAQESGGITIPLDRFSIGNVNSFHLATADYQYLGAIDFSQVLEGVQAGLTYDGGMGFEIGEITVALTAARQIDFANLNLTGIIGGGFSVDPLATVDFNNFFSADFVNEFDAGNSLTITDPRVLLNSFYLKSQNPQNYAQDIRQLHRIKVNVTQPTPKQIHTVRLSEGSLWLRGSRVVENHDSRPSESALWAQAGFALNQAQDLKFQIEIYPGRLTRQGELLVFLIQPTSHSQVFVPKVLGTVFGDPPQLMEISLDGGNSSVIDYGSISGKNGLTRPFCLASADVSLVLRLPKDSEGLTVPGSKFNVIDAELDFYSYVQGVHTKVLPSDNDFAEGFRIDVNDVPSPGVNRSWVIRERKISYLLSASQVTSSTHSVTLWNEVFLRTAQESTVGKIRVRLYYRGSAVGDESGVVVWFNRDDCI